MTPSPWRELRPWLALALGVWAAGVLLGRATARAGPPPAPAWQRSFLELDQGGQRLYRLLREGLTEAENSRAASGQWPAPAALAADGVPPFDAASWTLRRQGLAVAYRGEAEGLAWLVLFLEPDAASRAAVPPPPDEEHHTLPDGTALHVTVWTRPLDAPAGDEVPVFPATSGWTQRVGQGPAAGQ